MRALLVLLALAGPASASPTTDAWMTGLTDRVIEDVAAGKPLVAIVHVPLCDNTIIACGNAKLGDGDTPATNLYWATTPGFGKWFARKGSGWTRVAAETDATGDKDVLEQHTYRRSVTTSAAWRKRGAPKLNPDDVARARTRAPAYDRSHHYGESDFFIHPTFGVGQVKIVKQAERMVVVLFEDGQERTMIHAR